MALFALVRLSDNVVQQVEELNTPPFLNDHRWIRESDFVAGQVAAPGKIWDGVIPASFADAPVIPEDELPATGPEAWDAIQVAKEKVRMAEQNYAVIAGLNVPAE